MRHQFALRWNLTPNRLLSRLMSNPTKVMGIISDTHGLVRPQTIEALAGVEMILHAGDIGNQQVLDTLNAIAPVIAVRGNNDKGEWAIRFATVIMAQFPLCVRSQNSTSFYSLIRRWLRPQSLDL